MAQRRRSDRVWSIAERFSGGIFIAAVLATLTSVPAAAQNQPGCFWGVMAPNRVYLCPDATIEGDRSWRIVRSERLAPTRRTPQRQELQRREPEVREPRYTTIDDRRPPRAHLPTPRIYPRVGVGVNSGGDVNVGAGIGVGLGIFSLGVDLID